MTRQNPGKAVDTAGVPAGEPARTPGAPEFLTDAEMEALERARQGEASPEFLTDAEMEALEAGGGAHQRQPGPPGVRAVSQAPGAGGSTEAPMDSHRSGLYPTRLPGATMRADGFSSRILSRPATLGRLLASAFEDARSKAQSQAASVLRGLVRAARWEPELPGALPAIPTKPPAELLADVLDRNASSSGGRSEELAGGVHPEDLPTPVRLGMGAATLGVEVPKLTTELVGARGPIGRLARIGTLGALEAAGEGATPTQSVVEGLKSAASVVPFEAVGPLAGAITEPGALRAAVRGALTTGVMAGLDIAQGAQPEDALVRAVPWGVEALRHGGGGGEAAPEAARPTLRERVAARVAGDGVPVVEGKAAPEAARPTLRERVAARVAGRGAVGTSGPIGRQDVSAYMRREFGVPIRVGHFRRRALGLFKVQSEVVRTATADDLETTAHEVGHVLHKRVLGWADPGKLWPREARAELVALGRELYGDRQPAGGYAREGFAEFLAKWMAHPAEAEARAPKLAAWFRDVFMAEHPAEAAKLDGARALFERWRSQGAEARILGQIDGGTGRAPGLLGRIRRGVVTALTDRFEALRFAEQEMLGGRSVEPARSPYLLARVTADTAAAKARHFVLGGVYTFAGRRVAPGLAETLEPVSREIQPFLAYAYARRAVELHGRGIDPGVSRDDAAAVVEKYDGRPEFRAAVAGIKTWANALVDYLADAGGLSADAAQRIKDSSLAYIPLKRVFADVQGQRAGAGRGFVDLPQPMKRIKGSGRAIQDPLESLIEQAERIVSTADRARVARALVELAEATPGGGKWAERVDVGSHVHRTRLDAIARQLEAAGIDLSAADRDGMLTLFTNADSYSGKENIVSVYRDGKRVLYELDPDLYRAMKGLDAVTLPWFISATAGRAKRAVTLGATGIRAGFQLITNPIRDTWEAMLATHANPLSQPVRAVRALRDEFKGAPHVERWRASGGEIAQPLGVDRAFLKTLRDQMLASTAARKTAVASRHPIETMKGVMSLTEAMNRIA